MDIGYYQLLLASLILTNMELLETACFGAGAKIGTAPAPLLRDRFSGDPAEAIGGFYNQLRYIDVTVVEDGETVDVEMYDIDLFDNDASVVKALHRQGRRVVCYVSAGSWEDWRPDAGTFAEEVIGAPLAEWEGERWLDIRRSDLLGPIMEARMDLCKAKGFDAIEPDNVDAYINNTGFPLTYQDQLTYNIWLADAAHARGLSIGLKNDSDQIGDLVLIFDWALNEECFENDECESLLPFIDAGKAVFNVEYGLETAEFCIRANTLNFSSLRKNLSLDAWREPCAPITSPKLLSTTPPTRRSDGAVLLHAPGAPLSAQNPAFSPDGLSLLFTMFYSGYNGGPAGLFLLALAGGEVVELIKEDGHDAVNLPGSSWNADTGRIVFSSDREDIDEVWTMAADGTGLFRVTDHSTSALFIEPTFSPDGVWIVFELSDAAADGRQSSIWKVRADGTELVRLTVGARAGTDDRQPNWSPAGDRILFQRRGADDGWDLYTVTVEGAGLRQITSAASSDTDASWSSDGRWIVFSSDYGGIPVPNIFVVPASGGTPVRVTRSNTFEDSAPSWSGDGAWIAFESHPALDREAPASLWLIAAPPTDGVAD